MQDPMAALREAVRAKLSESGYEGEHLDEMVEACVMTDERLAFAVDEGTGEITMLLLANDNDPD